MKFRERSFRQQPQVRTTKAASSAFLCKSSNRVAGLTQASTSLFNNGDSVNGEDVIVLHPGSRYLRLGRATDTLPQTIPHCLARIKRSLPKRHFTLDEPTTDLVDVEEQHEFVAKLREGAKIKHNTSAQQQCSNFNSDAQWNTLSEHKDTKRIEWMDTAEAGQVVIGEDALSVDLVTFTLMHPIVRGELNLSMCSSVQEYIDELCFLWTSAINQRLNIAPSQLTEYRILLVVPDILSKESADLLAHVCLRMMSCKALTILHESLCTTYGAGIPRACIVDMGAQRISIACVEDGSIQSQSRICLNYGGDDISAYLLQLLKASSFPLADCRITRQYHLAMLDDLKAQILTMDITKCGLKEVPVVLREFNQLAQSTVIKIYDESILAATCVFFPETLNLTLSDKSTIQQDLTGVIVVFSHWKSSIPVHVTDSRRSEEDLQEAKILKYWNVANTQLNYEPPVADATGEKPTSINSSPPAAAAGSSDLSVPPIDIMDIDESNALVDKEVLPLDVAIICSILSLFKAIPNQDSMTEDDVTAAKTTRQEKIRRMFQSILVVGGGVAIIPGMLEALALRIMGLFQNVASEQFNTKPEDEMTLEQVSVLPAPREMDPRDLCWKGASVAGRLEAIKECWITREEWEAYGTDLFLDRALL